MKKDNCPCKDCERKCGREDTPPCQKGVKRLENRQK